MVWFCTEKVQQIYNLVKYLPIQRERAEGNYEVVALSSYDNVVYVRGNSRPFFESASCTLLTPEQFIKKVIGRSQGGNNV